MNGHTDPPERGCTEAAVGQEGRPLGRPWLPGTGLSDPRASKDSAAAAHPRGWRAGGRGVLGLAPLRRLGLEPGTQRPRDGSV